MSMAADISFTSSHTPSHRHTHHMHLGSNWYLNDRNGGWQKKRERKENEKKNCNGHFYRLKIVAIIPFYWRYVYLISTLFNWFSCLFMLLGIAAAFAVSLLLLLNCCRQILLSFGDDEDNCAKEQKKKNTNNNKACKHITTTFNSNDKQHCWTWTNISIHGQPQHTHKPTERKKKLKPIINPCMCYIIAYNNI